MVAGAYACVYAYVINIYFIIAYMYMHACLCMFVYISVCLCCACSRMFLYVCAIFLLVFGITYLAKTNPTPRINHHYSTVQVIEPPKRVMIEEEICTRLDGCPIINGVCVDCVTVKN